MSMTAIIALQLIGMFAVYFGLTFLLPHVVLGKTLRMRNGYERFLIYTVFGNFYVISLVYFLELLHISNTVTLILFTLVPCGYIKVKLERIPLNRKLGEFWDTLRQLAGGQLKFKAFRDRGKEKRGNLRKKRFKTFGKYLVKNAGDILLTVGFLGAAFYSFGTDLFVNYGYKLTDVVVHNYWINRLSENDIFAKGIYPFGYHNFLYYMHQVFGFDTYVLLRLMSLVVVTWVAAVLLCFLKLLCKSRYLPYIAVFAYVLFDYFESHTYIRFCALIPQEYSMLFVLPAIYGAFGFFREKRREITGSYAGKSKMYLWCYILSFSLTLSTHFYATIATGVFILATAIAFAGWLFRKQYFKKLFLGSVLSLIIAILPMAVAYAGGKDLEYSLKWGLSIITGIKPEVETSTDPNATEDARLDDLDKEVATETLLSVNKEKYIEEYGPLLGSVIATLETIEYDVDYGSIHYSNPIVIYSLMGVFVLLVIMGFLYLIPKAGDKMYGCVLISLGLFMIFMTVMMSAGDLGLPQLMDLNRSSIFFSYIVGAAVVLMLDSVFRLPFAKIKSPLAYNLFTFILLFPIGWYVYTTGAIREPITNTAFESNDAIVCLSKIIKDTDDGTWTICSANDEGRMIYNHGFHYELIDFLRAMEYIGSEGWLRIPSETVYFFVEKNPIDYYIAWEGSGTQIGEQYAQESLPLGNNRALYEGKNRWICMSRYYYWAEAFKELYPNETSVYYETDDFICYRVEQNPYRLFNFAIDYGYNK